MYGAMLGAYNTVAGLGMAQFNNELAREQQSHYLGLNYMYNERAAHNADIRTRRLYADFYSPEALMRQYEKAGLSPSMMFGGTPGQGGMSGAQGAGAAGPVGATYGVSLLEAAQAANLMAQTDKTKAETDTIQGNNERGWAEIKNILADSGNKEAAAEAAKADAAVKNWEAYVLKGSADWNIEQAYQLSRRMAFEADNAYHVSRSSAVRAEVDEATVEEQKQQVVKNLEMTIQNIAQSKATEALNKQQKEYLVEEMNSLVIGRMQEWFRIDILQEQQDTYNDWIEAQIPNLRKELEIKLGQLELEQKKLVINTVVESVKALCIGAAAASQFGRGSNATPANAHPSNYNGHKGMTPTGWK